MNCSCRSCQGPLLPHGVYAINWNLIIISAGSSPITHMHISQQNPYISTTQNTYTHTCGMCPINKQQWQPASHKFDFNISIYFECEFCGLISLLTEHMFLFYLRCYVPFNTYTYVFVLVVRPIYFRKYLLITCFWLSLVVVVDVFFLHIFALALPQFAQFDLLALIVIFFGFLIRSYANCCVLWLPGNYHVNIFKRL